MELRRAVLSVAFPVLACGLSPLIAGCGAAAQSPSPSPSASPAAVIDPTPTPTVTRSAAAPTPAPTKRSRLRRARDRWAQAAINSYAMTVRYGCLCGFGDGRKIRLRILDGELVEASTEGEPLSPRELRELRGFPVTVEQLFDLIASHRNADKLDVTYDKALGYPSSIEIDEDVNANDDAFSVHAIRLVPLDANP